MAKAIVSFTFVFLLAFIMGGWFLMPHLPPVPDHPVTVFEMEYWTTNWAGALIGLCLGSISARSILGRPNTALIWIFAVVLVALVAIAWLFSQSARLQRSSTDPARVPNPSTAESAAIAGTNAESPEQLVRQLMISVARSDRTGVERRIVPSPDAHFLWEMSDPKNADAMVDLFTTLPVEPMKVGDPLPDPFKPGLQVQPQMIDANHLVLKMQTKGKAAWAFFLVRTEGEWRVDMRWFINTLKESRT